jgi:hypothetical protein
MLDTPTGTVKRACTPVYGKKAVFAWALPGASAAIKNAITSATGQPINPESALFTQTSFVFRVPDDRQEAKLSHNSLSVPSGVRPTARSTSFMVGMPPWTCK